MVLGNCLFLFLVGLFLFVSFFGGVFVVFCLFVCSFVCLFVCLFVFWLRFLGLYCFLLGLFILFDAVGVCLVVCVACLMSFYSWFW